MTNRVKEKEYPTKFYIVSAFGYAKGPRQVLVTTTPSKLYAVFHTNPPQSPTAIPDPQIS